MPVGSPRWAALYLATAAFLSPCAATAQTPGTLSIVTNTSGNQGTGTVTGSVAISNLPAMQAVSDASVVAAINAAALPLPMPVTGNATTDGSTTIADGGTAQLLFNGAAPADGFEICNPGTRDDLWISDTATATVNGAGSVRVPSNGGCYTTPPGRKPLQAISVVAATTGDPITARGW